jgi:hypothetical protein
MLCVLCVLCGFGMPRSNTPAVKIQQRRGLSRAVRQFSSGTAEQDGEKCSVFWGSDGALSASSFRRGRRRTVTTIELLALREVLADRRCGLLDRLAVAAAAGKDDPEHIVDPGFLRLLADTHTAIAAVDAELAESAITGDAR